MKYLNRGGMPRTGTEWVANEWIERQREHEKEYTKRKERKEKKTNRERSEPRCCERLRNLEIGQRPNEREHRYAEYAKKRKKREEEENDEKTETLSPLAIAFASHATQTRLLFARRPVVVTLFYPLCLRDVRSRSFRFRQRRRPTHTHNAAHRTRSECHRNFSFRAEKIAFAPSPSVTASSYLCVDVCVSHAFVQNFDSCFDWQWQSQLPTAFVESILAAAQSP